MTQKKNETASGEGHTEPAFEPTDVRARNVLLVGIALFATVAICFGVVAGIVLLTAKQPGSPPSVLETVVVKDGPRLEVDPQGDRRDLQAQAEARIAAYGWVNRETGTARIPIDRAMALVNERGWPDKQESKSEQNQGAVAR